MPWSAACGFPAATGRERARKLQALLLIVWASPRAAVGASRFLLVAGLWLLRPGWLRSAGHAGALRCSCRELLLSAFPTGALRHTQEHGSSPAVAGMAQCWDLQLWQ